MDLMFKATDKAAWDAFVATITDISSVIIDEIGSIVVTPAVVENGEIVTQAVIDTAYHANVRITRPYYTYVGADGIEYSSGVDPAVLAEGGIGVEWIAPADVASPERVWAGGMNYWLPSTT